MKGRVAKDYRSSTVPVWWTAPTELSIKNDKYYTYALYLGQELINLSFRPRSFLRPPGFRKD